MGRQQQSTKVAGKHDIINVINGRANPFTAITISIVISIIKLCETTAAWRSIAAVAAVAAASVAAA